MLAVAVDLAKREGLPLPIPVTNYFPHLPDADESEEQRTVIEHLALQEWVRIPVADEHDALGPRATSGLRRYGLLYPPMVHRSSDIYALASGGVVLTGEGGDEVLGATRSTPLAHLRYRRGASTLPIIKASAASLAPAPVRRRLGARNFGDALPGWLQPAASEELLRELVADDVATPLSFARALRRLPYSRMAQVGFASLHRVASDAGTRLQHPLLSDRFLDALARQRGRLGFPTRTAAMTELFGFLLPPTTLRRRSKAVFNAVAVSEHSRKFALTWDGSGVDYELVDPEALRAEWLKDSPHAASLLPLQAAWLAGQSG